MGNSFAFAEAGRIATDPQLGYTQQGHPQVTFRLAVEDQRSDGRGGYEKAQVIFHDVVVWAKTAEQVAGSLTKGDAVIVTGDLRASAFTDGEGRERVGWEVRARNIGPNLALTDVTIDRSRREGATVARDASVSAGRQIQQSARQVEGPSL